MFVLLDVVPNELVSEPCSLALDELRIKADEVLTNGKTVTALRAHYHIDDLGWRGARGRPRAVLTHALGDRQPAVRRVIYHLGSRGCRAWPR